MDRDRREDGSKLLRCKSCMSHNYDEKAGSTPKDGNLKKAVNKPHNNSHSWCFSSFPVCQLTSLHLPLHPPTTPLLLPLVKSVKSSHFSISSQAALHKHVYAVRAHFLKFEPLLINIVCHIWQCYSTTMYVMYYSAVLW